MTWNVHINNVTSKAQKLLGFLRRNLQIKKEHTKSMAYKSLVRSKIEYCPTIWSLDYKTENQCRTARYTTGIFHNTINVTSMLDHLQWNSLEPSRNITKVPMMHKITHKLVAIKPDFYISPRTSHQRCSQSSIPNLQHLHWLLQIQHPPSYSCPFEFLTTWHCPCFFFESVQITDPNSLQLNIKQFLFCIM